jgi:biopolymer transport protein ExbB/TolQ
MDLAQLVQLASEHFPPFILLVAVANALLWIWLIVYSRSRKRNLADYLANAVRAFSRQSDITYNMSIDERINVFIADIRDAISGPGSQEAARSLLDRLMTKDESRLYLKTHRFEIGYSVARTLIEIFPLLGIVGTVIAIWAGMNTSGMNDADRISKVVQNFGHSVISTAFGLGAAILFMLVNSWFEPEFERLLEYAHEIRDVVAHAKVRLGFAPSAAAEKSK